MQVATRSEYPSTFSIGPDLNFKELLRPEAEKNAALVKRCDAALDKWLSDLEEGVLGGSAQGSVGCWAVLGDRDLWVYRVYTQSHQSKHMTARPNSNMRQRCAVGAALCGELAS
eukprot:1156014-Pelagomonas_calceolata.AAC.19